MLVKLARSAALDRYLALHRELVGRCSWEVAVLPRPVEPAIAAFRDGLRGWRDSHLPIPPPALMGVNGDSGRPDAATLLVAGAIDAARAMLDPAIDALADHRERAEAELTQRLLLDRTGQRLMAAMGTPDATLELPVYLVPFAPYPPAVGFLVERGRTVGAYVDCRRYLGSTLAEAVLTQLAWALLRDEAHPEHLLMRVRALLPGSGPYPRRLRLILTKTLVELTAGHLVRATDPSHRPCVDVLGTAWRFPRLYDLTRRHWCRYLDGTTGRDEALAAIASEATTRSPRWYVDHVDAAALAADFYLLEWMAARGDTAARTRLAQWTPHLTADLAGQLDLIIGTELGHYECAAVHTIAPALAAFLRRVNSGDSRVGWWRARTDIGEVPALDLAVAAFAGPGVEYGGEAWAGIASMLRQFAAGELPARVFIDQCFTLQHHNGCLFDKYFDAEQLQVVLDAQATGDLVVLARHASAEVRQHWRSYQRRLGKGHSARWLGEKPAVGEPPVRLTGRLSLGAAPPGGVGCGSREEPRHFVPSPPDQDQPVRPRAWQFRRPWPSEPRRFDRATAILHTSLGKIELQLWPRRAPHTVDNFVALADGRRAWRDPLTGLTRRDPFYDATTFHRRVPGFVIEAGDRSGTGRGGPGYRIPDEIGSSATFDRPFLLAMANSGRDSAGSRFFITLCCARHLDAAFVQFGEVCDPASRDVVTAVAGSGPPVTLERVIIDAA